MPDQQQTVDNSSNSQNQQTMNGQSVEENIQENASWETYTLKAVSKKGTGILTEELGDKNWLNFESDYLVDRDKDQLQNELQELNQNKDQWGEPIQLKMFNKGTAEDPQKVFIDYRIPNEDQLPEGFQKADSSYDSNGGSNRGGQRSDSSDSESMGDVQYDQIIARLQKHTDGDYSVTTDLMETPHEYEVVRAIIEYRHDDQENQVTGYGTSADSNMKQKIEHAETRAVKRAVKHSGILKAEDDE